MMGSMTYRVQYHYSGSWRYSQVPSLHPSGPVFERISISAATKKIVNDLRKRFGQTIRVRLYEQHSVSNNWQLYCLFHILLRLTTRKHQNCALLALCEANNWWLVDSLLKEPVMQQAFPTR